MATASGHSPYEAVPLSLENREIRLVVVIPTPSPPVRCQFLSYRLDQCPPYAALSYSWGSPDERGRISLGSSEVSVGRNLFTFLLRVSRNGYNSVFWIDALCINQEDVPERNHQVGMMKDIYCNAYRVVIWLGEASPRDYAAMLLVKQAHREASKNVERVSRRRDTTMPGKEIVLSLYEHEYWTRVWIVQEVMYAKNLVIYWGKGTLLWEWLARVSEFSEKDRLYSTPGAIIIRAKAEWNGPVPLANLIPKYLHLDSSDVRDKVFGLLGMASQGSDDPIKADYSMNLGEVFQATCRHVFRSGFFTFVHEMVVFGKSLRDSLGVPFPERRLVELLREPENILREGQRSKRNNKRRIRGRHLGDTRQ